MIEKENNTFITDETIKQTEFNKTVLSIETKQHININIEKILKSQGFSNIKLSDIGWSSVAYNAMFDEKDYIIRIPRIGGSGFDTYIKEHAILEIIAGNIKSVKVPRTHLYESDELKYVAHEKIIGNGFNIDSFEKLSNIEQDNFCQSAANFLSELHSINIDEFSNISGLRWGKLETKYLRECFEKYLKFLKEEKWEESFVLSKREIDTFCNLIDSVTSINNPEVLLHRDFHEDNFVIDDQMRLIGVFDFGNCSLANRAIDFNNFIERNDDGTFEESLLLKKLLFFYEQASGIRITFNDIVNQVRLSDGYCISWLVSTDEVLNNNKDHLRDCVKRIKKWLGRYMKDNL